MLKTEHKFKAKTVCDQSFIEQEPQPELVLLTRYISATIWKKMETARINPNAFAREV